MPDNLLAYLFAYHRAPFILSVLLACAAATSGSAFAQSTAGSVSQQAPKSDSKTPGTKTTPVQAGGGAYLGVYLGDVNAERANALHLKEIRGAIVGRVEEGSPAAKAGLRENDVILNFNDERVRNRSHFHHLLIESQPGSKVALKINRKGADQSVEVILGQSRSSDLDERGILFKEADAILARAEELHKEAVEASQNGDEKKARDLFDQEKTFRNESESRRAAIEEKLRSGEIPLSSSSRRPGNNLNSNPYQIGLSVTPLTEQLAAFFNAARGGVLITEVSAGELGERNGLKAGDCIVTVDGEPVKSASDLNRLINQKSSGELEFAVIRDRAERNIKIKLAQQ